MLDPFLNPSSFIKVDGTSVTTAAIPFAVGLSVPDDVLVSFGDDTDTTFHMDNAADRFEILSDKNILIQPKDITAGSGLLLSKLPWSPTIPHIGAVGGSLGTGPICYLQDPLGVSDATLIWANPAFPTNFTLVVFQFASATNIFSMAALGGTVDFDLSPNGDLVLDPTGDILVQEPMIFETGSSATFEDEIVAGWGDTNEATITWLNATSTFEINSSVTLDISGDTMTKVGADGDIDLFGSTLRIIGPTTDLKADGGDATHRFNDFHILQPYFYAEPIHSTGYSRIGDIIRLTNTNSQNVNSAATDNLVQWNQQDAIDTDTYTHSTSTNNSRLTVDTTGNYLIGVILSITSAGQRQASDVRIRINGSTAVAYRGSTGYIRNANFHDTASLHLSIPISLTAADYIEVLVDRASSLTGSATLVSGESLFSMVRVQ